MFLNSVKYNLPKLYFIRAFQWFLLVMPILVLFFQENGLSMQDILFLQAVFSITIVFFEIPSGYFADRIGRKNSILVGIIMGLIGFTFYAFSYSFYGFLWAELVLGLGAGFISGADSALLYDTLLFLKKEQDFRKEEGRLLAIGHFSESVAGILGGFLATISLRTPFYWKILVILFSLTFALTLKEPQREKGVQEGNSFQNILKIVRYALYGEIKIKWLILYASVVWASTFTMVWFIQPYLKLVDLPLVYWGIVWSILNFSVGVSALLTQKFENILGTQKALTLLFLISVVGYLILAKFLSLWAIPVFLLFYFVRGIGDPMLKDYLNQLISSDIRATVLSIKNLVGRLLFVFLGPFLGWIADVWTLQTAFLSAGMIFLFLGILTLYFFLETKK